ncbi:GATA transcription factor 7-like [Aristolochia californica]|uniref:GATA transcription factor 7-like n=1 Tax=Aristolochia californica TaxID=171875 RepID=UPI0035DCF281
MKSCRNVSLSGGFLPPEQLQERDVSHGASGFDEFFPGETKEESDVGLEWLSVFIEDSFSSHGISIPPPNNFQDSVSKASQIHQKPSDQQQNLRTSVSESSESHQKPCEREEVSVPGKTRGTKRKRTKTISTLLSGCGSYRHMQNQLLLLTTSDPPLLPQTHWLADSELIAPKKAEEEVEETQLVADSEPIVPMKELKEGEEKEERGKYSGHGHGHGQSKRCSHCLSQNTPQWRAGPLGPKTLCNACGVRYKSGRLFPEYRPAKSPTFVEYKHSNSHKIVMKMRMMANVT